MHGIGRSTSTAALFYIPGLKEPRRETGPAAMGRPPWGSSMGFT